MAFEVFDYRKDIRNLLVTPQIRSRFLKMEVGQFNRSHTHDLGHEIFLILQGQAKFDIEGHTEVLGPGQMCIALTDEAHTVRNVGEDEVIMYLSVTPHIHPTHTYWTEDGKKTPPCFNKSGSFDVPADESKETVSLVDSHLATVEKLAEAVRTAVQIQREQTRAFKHAYREDNRAAACDARNAMWAALYPMFKEVHALAGLWNEFTARTEDEEQSD